MRHTKFGLAAMVAVLLTSGAANTPASADGGTLTTNVNATATAFQVDAVHERVTLPLFRGVQNGQTVWYVITESSSKDDAERRGVNWSGKLANALGTRAVQRVTVVNGVINFAGGVDFSPTRIVIPGPTGNEFLDLRRTRLGHPCRSETDDHQIHVRATHVSHPGCTVWCNSWGNSTESVQRYRHRQRRATTPRPVFQL